MPLRSAASRSRHTGLANGRTKGAMSFSSASSASRSTGGFAEAGAERVVVGAQAVELGAEIVEMGEVADADRAAADLVLISRADAAAGGADLARAAGILAQAVEVAVDGQDQRAGLGDPQHVGGDRRRPARRNLLDFGLERPRVEHHAIADDRRGAADDSRGQQRQFVGVVADHQGVAGIVAALEADDHVGPAREPVDDLALAFVAPLGADDGYIGHFEIPCLEGARLLGARAACVQRSGRLIGRKLLAIGGTGRAAHAYCRAGSPLLSP